jgi:carbamate kinase
VEAVIDKDLASALLAEDIRADALAIVTDVDAVYAGWGTPEQRAIRRATPEALADTEFAAGSMGPKVRAACSFVEESGGLAAIGSIEDTPALLRGEAGTIVTREADGLELERSPATQGAGNE